MPAPCPLYRTRRTPRLLLCDLAARRRYFLSGVPCLQVAHPIARTITSLTAFAFGDDSRRYQYKPSTLQYRAPVITGLWSFATFGGSHSD